MYQLQRPSLGGLSGFGLGPLSHTQKPSKESVELGSKRIESVAKVTVQPHDDFWREEPGLPKTSKPVFSYANAVRGSPKAKKKRGKKRSSNWTGPLIGHQLSHDNHLCDHEDLLLRASPLGTSELEHRKISYSETERREKD